MFWVSRIRLTGFDPPQTPYIYQFAEGDAERARECALSDVARFYPPLPPFVFSGALL
jgi:hypothetical protein